MTFENSFIYEKKSKGHERFCTFFAPLPNFFSNRSWAMIFWVFFNLYDSDSKGGYLKRAILWHVQTLQQGDSRTRFEIQAPFRPVYRILRNLISFKNRFKLLWFWFYDSQLDYEFNSVFNIKFPVLQWYLGSVSFPLTLQLSLPHQYSAFFCFKQGLRVIQNCHLPGENEKNCNFPKFSKKIVNFAFL